MPIVFVINTKIIAIEHFPKFYLNSDLLIKQWIIFTVKISIVSITIQIFHLLDFSWQWSFNEWNHGLISKKLQLIQWHDSNIQSFLIYFENCDHCKRNRKFFCFSFESIVHLTGEIIFFLFHYYVDDIRWWFSYFLFAYIRPMVMGYGIKINEDFVVQISNSSDKIYIIYCVYGNPLKRDLVERKLFYLVGKF